MLWQTYNHQLSLLRWLRYGRLFLDLIELYGYLKLKPHIQRSSSSRPEPSRDLTVISPTLGTEDEYAQRLRAWLSHNPKELIIVAPTSSTSYLEDIVEKVNDPRVSLIRSPPSNKNVHMCDALRRVQTPLVLFIDDRVTWSSQTLNRLTDAFADSRIGGAITACEVPLHARSTAWDKFGALNLVRRNVLHSFLAHFNSGQVLNLGGRSMAYRTEILQQDRFYKAVDEDAWLGRYPLKSGDDNIMTTWTVRQGWQTIFLNQSDAHIKGLVNPNASYVKEVLRWSRDTARWYLRDWGHAWATKSRSAFVRVSLNTLTNYATDFCVLLEAIVLTNLTITHLLMPHSLTYNIR